MSAANVLAECKPESAILPGECITVGAKRLRHWARQKTCRGKRLIHCCRLCVLRPVDTRMSLAVLDPIIEWSPD